MFAVESQEKRFRSRQKKKRNQRVLPIWQNEKRKKIRIEEIETGFGLPEWYTYAYHNETDNPFSSSTRLKLIGKSLCARTMAEKFHIFSVYFAER